MLLCALSVFSVVLMGSTLQHGEHRMWQSVPSHEQCCANVHLLYRQTRVTTCISFLQCGSNISVCHFHLEKEKNNWSCDYFFFLPATRVYFVMRRKVYLQRPKS